MKIGIAGAGLMGRLLAFKLLQLGHNITLFDKDDVQGHQSCGWVAAGMLTPYAEIETAEPQLLNYGLAGLSLWVDIVASLPGEVYLQRQGSIIVAHQADKADYERFIKQIKTKTSRHDSLLLLNQNSLHDYEPELNFQHACYLSEEGQIANEQFYPAIAEYLLQHDVHWLANTEVTHIKPYQIITEQQTFQFDWVFDCRGLGAKDDLPQLRAVRGEVIRLYAPEVNIVHPVRLMHPRYAIYIVPRPKQQFIIGASSIESADMSQISVQSCLELLSAAYSVHKGFAEARIIATLTQCRPALMNNLPKIIWAEGLTRLNGLFRHGYLLGPLLADETARLLSNGVEALHFPELVTTDEVII